MDVKEAYSIVKNRFPNKKISNKAFQYEGSWVFRPYFDCKVSGMALYFVDEKGNFSISTMMRIPEKGRFIEAAKKVVYINGIESDKME